MNTKIILNLIALFIVVLTLNACDQSDRESIETSSIERLTAETAEAVSDERKLDLEEEERVFNVCQGEAKNMQLEGTEAEKFIDECIYVNTEEVINSEEDLLEFIENNSDDELRNND